MAVSGMRSINVDVPSELFDRLHEAATRSDRPLEAVLVEGLALLFGTPPVDRAALSDALETLPDAKLWALVYSRLAWPQGARLRELSANGRQAPLSGVEQAELTALIDQADDLSLLRSRALLILQQRGHDIREQLQLGA